jgi:hypothetical protein
MARPRMASVFAVIALSKQELRDALGCSITVIDKAVAAGHLRAYRPPTGIKRKKYLVVDVIDWVRTHWRTA